MGIRKKSFLTLLALAAILGCAAACSYYGSEEKAFSGDCAISTEKINVYETLQVGNDENAALLDAAGSKLLVVTYSDLQPGDDGFTEEGYSSFSKRVVVYDCAKKEIASEISLADGELCTGGLLMDNEVVCTIVTRDNGGCRASVVRFNADSQPETLFTCAALNDSCYVPQFSRVGGDGFLFTYYDRENPAFGIYHVSGSGGFQELYASHNTDDFIGTEIKTNGDKFLYCAAIDGKPSLLIGGLESEPVAIPLESTQYLHAFGLSEEYVLVSLQERDEGSPSFKDILCVYDLSGNLLLSQPGGPLFGITGDMAGGLFATDMDYNVLSLTISQNAGEVGLNRRLLDLPEDSTLFYPVSPGTCLASSGAGKPSFVKISAH